jgi:hypothetical protein
MIIFKNFHSIENKTNKTPAVSSIRRGQNEAAASGG